MELTLIRTNLDATSTQGELLVDNQKQFVTLELPVRDGLPGSAIPPGTYPIEMLPSPKFEMSQDAWILKYAGAIPHLLLIPNRSNILIHWGNDAADTEGCILVGEVLEKDFIASSRSAFELLWTYLMAAKGRGETLSITVEGGIPEIVTNRDNVQQALDEG